MSNSIFGFNCPKCDGYGNLYWDKKRKEYLCPDCHRLYTPPYMTLVDLQGNNKKLWNLEVGMYEQFKAIEDIEWCGWMVRSKQDTLYSLTPKTRVLVYHMEYFGDYDCGRCVDYQFFNKDMAKCTSVACKPMSVPWREKKDIQWPPEKSRYVTWSNAY